jgi:hypothetical protein
MTVSAGQLWELRTQSMGELARFRVDRVEGDMAYGTMVDGGRAASFHTSTLERHKRGARLVQNTNRPPHPQKPPGAEGRQERDLTASDYRRVQPPRGMTPMEREEWLRSKA